MRSVFSGARALGVAAVVGILLAGMAFAASPETSVSAPSTLDQWVRQVERALGRPGADGFETEAATKNAEANVLHDPDGELYRSLAAGVPDLEHLPAALADLQSAVQRLQVISPEDPRRASAELRFQAALTAVWGVLAARRGAAGGCRRAAGGALG